MHCKDEAVFDAAFICPGKPQYTSVFQLENLQMPKGQDFAYRRKKLTGVAVSYYEAVNTTARFYEHLCTSFLRQLLVCRNASHSFVKEGSLLKYPGFSLMGV